jgi:hypothetical protein
MGDPSAYCPHACQPLRSKPHATLNTALAVHRGEGGQEELYEYVLGPLPQIPDL